MSRCAGAGREHSQAASPSWPMEIFHTIGVMLSLWMGLARALELLGVSTISFSSGSWKSLLWVWSFFGSSVKFPVSVSSAFCHRCLRTSYSICRWVVRRKLYCLFCILIIIIIISSSNSSSSSSSSSSSIFICCFIKLSLSQSMSFIFCPFSSWS